jgi:cysteinyl-tRNA synthetase
MANVWMHGGLLQFEGKKMSKSLGNFEPLSALLDRHDAQAIRLLFLQTGYRKPMNFTEDSIGSATTGLARLFGAYDQLRHAPPSARRDESPDAVDAFEERFNAALDDDLNTSGAVSVLFELANEVKATIASGAASRAAAFVHAALGILGLSPAERSHATSQPKDGLAADFVHRLQEKLHGILTLDGNGELAHVAIERVIAARNEARANRDFARADHLRVALAEAGVTLADSKEGTTWTANV